MGIEEAIIAEITEKAEKRGEKRGEKSGMELANVSAIKRMQQKGLSSESIADLLGLDIDYVKSKI